MTQGEIAKNKHIQNTESHAALINLDSSLDLARYARPDGSDRDSGSRTFSLSTTRICEMPLRTNRRAETLRVFWMIGMYRNWRRRIVVFFAFSHQISH